MTHFIRKILKVKGRQSIGYHKYPLNFLKNHPDFIIIGSQKAATSTLHAMLSMHPQLQSSSVKETQFYNMNYERGLQYYLSCFPIKKKGHLTFESTPDYIDHPKVPELVNAHNPNTKLIVTLREPVSRAFSHFNHVQRFNEEERKISFEQGLDLEENRISEALKGMNLDRYNSARHLSNYGYKRKGEYALHLKNWLQYFPIDQCHFIEFSEITSHKSAETFNRLFKFLDISTFKFEINLKVNVTDYRSEMNTKTREDLAKYYSDKNQELFKIIGNEYDW